MASTTLSLFWNLSSNSVEDRIDASAKLVSVLETFQAQHVPSASSGETSSEDEDEEDGDGGQPRSRKDSLDRSNAPDVAYSIRRLVRGLASPRESSRLGFAVALTEVRPIHHV
jgi:DNA polymerase phi